MYVITYYESKDYKWELATKVTENINEVTDLLKEIDEYSEYYSLVSVTYNTVTNW